jgi:hypothetical protein
LVPGVEPRGATGDNGAGQLVERESGTVRPAGIVRPVLGGQAPVDIRQVAAADPARRRADKHLTIDEIGGLRSRHLDSLEPPRTGEPVRPHRLQLPTPSF